MHIGATLERIRAQGGGKAKLAMTALIWICHSKRPLLVDELCHALTVEIGSTHLVTTMCLGLRRCLPAYLLSRASHYR